MPRIVTDNLVVDYDEAGFGIPLVFIHGITDSKSAFHYQLSGLQSDYHVISYNLRNGLRNPLEYTLDLLVEDLRRFLDAMELSGVVLCGHSFGALIAIAFAVTHPDRTSALIPVSGFSGALHDESDTVLMSKLKTRYQHNRSLGSKLKLHITRFLTGRSEDIIKISHENAILRRLSQEARNVNETTMVQRLRVIRKADIQKLLPEISVPTLIVVGAEDTPFMLSSAQYMYEHIPDASLEVIENAARYCFITHHDLFNAVIDDFLKERLVQIS